LLFNSQIFLLFFLPVVVASYWGLARYRRSGHPGFRLLLLLASWIFYAYWDIRLLPLLLTSIAINYGLISILQRSEVSRKLFLVTGIALNLSVLGFF
jgi:alginate O-acetyltransferase complex protein AlgI